MSSRAAAAKKATRKDKEKERRKNAIARLKEQKHVEREEKRKGKVEEAKKEVALDEKKKDERGDEAVDAVAERGVDRDEHAEVEAEPEVEVDADTKERFLGMTNGSCGPLSCAPDPKSIKVDGFSYCMTQTDTEWIFCWYFTVTNCTQKTLGGASVFFDIQSYQSTAPFTPGPGFFGNVAVDYDIETSVMGGAAVGTYAGAGVFYSGFSLPVGESWFSLCATLPKATFPSVDATVILPSAFYARVPLYQDTVYVLPAQGCDPQELPLFYSQTFALPTTWTQNTPAALGNFTIPGLGANLFGDWVVYATEANYTTTAVAGGPTAFPLLFNNVAITYNVVHANTFLSPDNTVTVSRKVAAASPLYLPGSSAVSFSPVQNVTIAGGGTVTVIASRRSVYYGPQLP